MSYWANLAGYATPYVAAATAGAFGAAREGVSKKVKGYVAAANEEVHLHVANVFHQASVALKGARHTSAAPFGTRFFRPPRIGKNRSAGHRAGSPPIPPPRPGKGYTPGYWRGGSPLEWTKFKAAQRAKSRSSMGIETMAWRDPFRTDYKVDTELTSLRTRKPRRGFETDRARKGSIFFRRR